MCDRKWRGIGGIPESGLSLREEYAEFDADRVFGTEGVTADEPCGVHQRRGAARAEEADRLHCFRDALHAGKSAGRSDGFLRGRLRRLLPISPARDGGKGEQLMPRDTKIDVALSCPVPIPATESVLLGHGSGGRMSGNLRGTFSCRPCKIPCSNGWTIKPLSKYGGSRIGLHDRLFRREAAVLPRRRHRNAGSQRHRERSGDGRR